MSAPASRAVPDLQQTFAAAFPETPLPSSLMRRLQALTPCRSLGTGQVLFAEGQVPKSFYVMAAGEIEARFIAEDGHTSTLERMQAPRVFGLAAFVTGRPARYEAAALQPSLVWVITEPAYCLLMDDCPGFARALMREFARRFEGNLGLLEAARHQAAPERLRLALRQLVRERGEAPDEEGWQQVAATQLELARSAHLSRQTVNELLRAAEAQGWVRRRYGGLLLNISIDDAGLGKAN